MRSGLDAALGRVALVLRLLGAVWIVLLALASALTGQLQAPVGSWAITAVAVAWAVVAWRAGLIEHRRGIGVAVADVAVTVVVILGPGLLGETATFSGGYPFAALVVALAVDGRRGVILTASVLSVATLADLVSVGSPSLAFATSNVLLYGFGAAALVLGLEVIDAQERRTRAQEMRTREAEAALAVARERASTAAHLHDSVLQTLALVQRRADDAGTVRSLARRQERELREWLFPQAAASGAAGSGAAGAGAAGSGAVGAGAAGPGAVAVAGEGRGGGTLRSVLESHAEDVVGDYDVAVRVVCTGAAASLAVPPEGEDGVRAVVLAAREAMLNAAAHAEVAAVDVYAEGDGRDLVVFVRDRGRGFDLDAVAADRQGVRGSIIARMARAGGSAEVRTAPGRGTEVVLRMAVDGQEGMAGG